MGEKIKKTTNVIKKEGNNNLKYLLVLSVIGILLLFSVSLSFAHGVMNNDNNENVEVLKESNVKEKFIETMNEMHEEMTSTFNDSLKKKLDVIHEDHMKEFLSALNEDELKEVMSFMEKRQQSMGQQPTNNEGMFSMMKHMMGMMNSMMQMMDSNMMQGMADDEMDDMGMQGMPMNR